MINPTNLGGTSESVLANINANIANKYLFQYCLKNQSNFLKIENKAYLILSLSPKDLFMKK